MKLTPRDRELIRDVGLSHVLSRDLTIRLGYFGSVTRANTRLRQLGNEGLVKRLDTAFFSQGLYTVGPLAHELFEPALARLVRARAGSPRFLLHALATGEVRAELTRRSGASWRFEQELWRKLPGPEGGEVRPDGLVTAGVPVFVEVDLGNASLPKVRAKLDAYRSLARSGLCRDLYGFEDFNLLVVTTGNLRSRHISRQLPDDPGFGFMTQTFKDLGLACPSSWS